jgi:hypothetical protein
MQSILFFQGAPVTVEFSQPRQLVPESGERRNGNPFSWPGYDVSINSRTIRDLPPRQAHPGENRLSLGEDTNPCRIDQLE